MDLATGSLLFLGLVFAVLGVSSKIMGIALLDPLISTNLGYLTAVNTCLLLALVIEKFQKK